MHVHKYAAAARARSKRLQHRGEVAVIKYHPLIWPEVQKACEGDFSRVKVEAVEDGLIISVTIRNNGKRK